MAMTHCRWLTCCSNLPRATVCLDPWAGDCDSTATENRLQKGRAMLRMRVIRNKQVARNGVPFPS
jgi:hypothetical protein